MASATLSRIALLHDRDFEREVLVVGRVPGERPRPVEEAKLPAHDRAMALVAAAARLVRWTRLVTSTSTATRSGRWSRAPFGGGLLADTSARGLRSFHLVGPVIIEKSVWHGMAR